MTTITVTGAMWGYLHSLPSLTSPARITPGARSATYGRVDDAVEGWDSDVYYVAIADGMHNGKPMLSAGVDAGAFYPERLFMWGEDEDGNQPSRLALLATMRSLLYGTPVVRKLDPSCWLPVMCWRGYKGGQPSYWSALRASTDAHVYKPELLRDLQRNLTLESNYEVYDAGIYAEIYID